MNTLPKIKTCQRARHPGIQSDIIITNKSTISDENIKIKAEENQNIKIKNKNKNWSPLKQMTVLKTKVFLLKCSTIII